MVESLTQRTKSWEDERGLPFMFDGVHLLTFPSHESDATILSTFLYHLELVAWISLCTTMLTGAVTVYAERIQESQGREGRGKTPSKGIG